MQQDQQRRKQQAIRELELLERMAGGMAQMDRLEDWKQARQQSLGAWRKKYGRLAQEIEQEREKALLDSLL